MNKPLDKKIILSANPWLQDVKILEQSVSTQLDAKADGQANTLYMSEKQTGIYGRFGREYFASPEGGIYMTLLLKPLVSLEELPNYTLLAAAAVVSAIENLTDKKPLIKWVNDIYLNNKKIVGILAEAQLQPDRSMQVALGIGINFHIESFPESLADKAGSLFTEQPALTRSELVAEIWSEFQKLSDRDFFDIYKSHSLVLGKTVEFEENKIQYKGLAKDLTQDGQLIIQLEDGQKKILSSGEISLKKWT
ncbi:biotin--[acetyl-CoA-carboxylase] ligase [Lactococcus garvieae]|uniref:biotin--[biotin carboxyl-carrier protein] ligase n=1 Tax=Lactococcus garvieae DCC43 TaxID=1231377 RepID=K2PY19_9LACT|nr:biotin--[acetyl-CoA-carboxylase] ligase [Lactococcus garvieae]EKF52356.1 Biotin-protein ligase / Biotin operon repressor [Lactococcus garvieae DCC43]